MLSSGSFRSSLYLKRSFTKLSYNLTNSQLSSINQNSIVIKDHNNIELPSLVKSSGARLEKLRSQPIKEFSHFLTDNYGRKHDYLRISITERCNLRCVYCMPEEGIELSPSDKLLTTDEIIKIAKIFVYQGVTKVRLTGGEPTVRKDIIELVKRLNEIDGLKEICITSNGLALHRKLPQLFQNGLTALNLSLDTLINGTRKPIFTSYHQIGRRFFSTSTNDKSDSPRLTHLTNKGEAHMVDVGNKQITHRIAIAKGKIKFSNELPLQLIKSNGNKKGDVISVSRIAGIMAVKKTSELIPLCHPISITKIKVEFEINERENFIEVETRVECDGKTGVEMEALTGVNISLLTVYDMCKAVDKLMVINECKVVSKSGGKSGDWIVK